MLLIAGLVLLVTLLFYRKNRHNKKFKDFDGPSSWLSLPMVGHSWLLGSESVPKLLECQKKFGDVFKFDIGDLDTIIVCDHDLVKEAFAKDVFSGRSWNEIPTFLHGMCPPGEDGKPIRTVTLAEGPEWVELRKFMMRNLSSVGVGNKNVLDEIIEEEASDVMASFEKKKGEPVKSHPLFIRSTNNIIFRLCTGKRSSKDDPKVIEITKRIETMFKDQDPTNPWNLLPNSSLRVSKMLQFLGVPTFFQRCGQVLEILDDEVRNAEADEHGNYIERALHEKNLIDKGNVKSVLRGPDGLKSIRGQAAELYVAGSDTTATYMEWIILYLLKHPEWQEKIFDEISSLTGDNSRPMSLTDRENSHLINAFLDEVARFVPMLILPPGRKTMADVFLDGKLIPKGTQVIPFSYPVNHDAKHYAKPDDFMPERFLVSDGDSLKYQKDGHILFFGFGKRRCIGEVLARAESFLFTARMVQKFRLRHEDPDQLTFKAMTSLVQFPEPFEFFTEPRN